MYLQAVQVPATGRLTLGRRSLGRLRSCRRCGLGNLGLAANSGKLISTAAGIGGTSIATAAGAGSLAGPIGAGVGVLVGVIAGLFAAHDARKKGAQNENQAVNAFLPAFDGSMQAIFQAANSGSISATDAISACQQVLQQWWASMAPWQTGPGTGDASHGGANCAALAAAQAKKNQCNKSCTAGCCVGCMDLYPGVMNAIAVFQAGGGTANFPQVFGSSYGASGRAGYSLTYTPPANTTNSVAAALGVSGSTVAGIPTWMIALAGAAALGFYVLG